MRIDYSRWWDDIAATARANASILLAVAGAFVFLPALVAGLFTLPMEPLAEGATPAEALQRLTGYVGANAVPQLVLLLFTVLGQLVAYTVLLDPRRPSVGDAFRLGLPLFLPLLLVNILVNLLVGFGFVLLIVPGLYLAGRTIVAVAAAVAERRGNPLASVGRSFALTRGQGWRIFFFIFLVFLVAFIVQIAVNGTLGTGIGLLPGADDRFSLRSLLLAALGALFTALFFILGVLLSVALYRRLTAEAPAADDARAI